MSKNEVKEVKEVVDRLTTGAEMMQIGLPVPAEVLCEAAETILRLTRELAEERKDGERWRQWMRFWMNSSPSAGQLPEQVTSLIGDMSLDEAMDAARKPQEVKLPNEHKEDAEGA